jgi:hypothetical protein
MHIADLYNKHKGQDIYIVGTGPSMRVFPLEILDGKITLGLNQAWRYRTLTYSITVHPELLKLYNKTRTRNQTQWIVKQKRPMAHLKFDDPEYYVFVTEQKITICFTSLKSIHYLSSVACSKRLCIWQC